MRTATIFVLGLVALACFVSLSSANFISAASTFEVGTVSSPAKYQVWSLTASSACPIGYYYFSVSAPGTAVVKYTAGTFGKAQVDTVAYSTATSVGASAAASYHLIFSISVTPLTTCTINIGVGSNAGTVTLNTLETLLDDVKYTRIVGGSYVASTSTINVGFNNGGAYEVKDIAVHPTCPTGTYMLSATQGGTSASFLQRGVALDTVSYDWQYTIGYNTDTSYNFWWELRPLLNSPNYVCYVSVKVARSASTGTMNLFGVDTLFDGTSGLLITNA